MFDPERYRREVLDPAKSAGNRPTDDLMLRYQLPSNLDPAGIARAVADVTAHWRQQRGKLAYRDVINRLETDHHQLLPLLTGPVAQLRQRIAEAQRQAQARSGDVAEELAGFAEATGMVSPAMVDQIAAHGHDRAQVMAVAAQKGIAVRPPDVLATEPPVPSPQLRSDLSTLDCRHIADFLLGKEALSGGFSIFEGYRLSLDSAHVDQLGREWAQRPGNRKAAEGVLAVLRLLTPQQMQALLQFQCAAAVRGRRDLHFSTTDWLRVARALGLAEQDAKRLVFAVRCEEARAARSPLAGQLDELLAARQVMAAYQLVYGVAPETLPDDARVSAAQAIQTAQAALELRDRAAAQRDADAAWRLLDDAVGLAPDLPGVRELRRGWPPRPAGPASSKVEGAAVVVTWQRSPSTAGPVGYTVLRGGRAIGDTTQTSYRDTDPPANEALDYSVVAQRGEAAAQAGPAAAPVWVLPDVGELETASSDDLVSASWARPPRAEAVVVRRAARPPAGVTDGDEVAVPPGAAGFDDRGARSGTTYHYLVTAVYLGADGKTRHANGIRFSATPARPPQPVAELAVESDRAEPGWLLVTFDPPESGTVELRELDEPPEFEPGTRLRTSALPGRKVRQAHPVPGGIRCRPTTGAVVLLAVTVAADAAVIGAHREWLPIAAPPALRQQRRGDRVLLTWQWPDDVSEMEVSWQLPDGQWQRESVSAARFEAEGGMSVTPPSGTAVAFRVAPVVLTQRGRQLGDARSIVVQMPVQGSYTVKTRGKRVTASVSVAQPVEVARLVLVLSRGRQMPLRVDDGEVLATLDEVRAAPGSPVTLEASVAGVPRPYWVRCFAEGGALDLSDPPRKQLYAGRRLWRN